MVTSFALSDDFGGAVKLEDGSLKIQCKGLGTAAFTDHILELL